MPRDAPDALWSLMRPPALLFLSAATSLLIACPSTPSSDEPAPDREGSAAQEAATDEEAAEQPASQPASQPSGEAASQPTPSAVSPAAIDARVTEANERLARSEAGALVRRAIDAHGGLRAYFTNGALRFRFRYAPLGERAPIDTVQTIDTWSARAVHHLTDQPEVRFGWDGDVAWLTPADAQVPTNPRFWALTPYYFVGVPFVFADPGVQLERIEPEVFEERTYERVRVTFGDDVGDAPDDYYILLVEAATGRVGGVRYIVSYPGFFPDGGHSPEKLMIYDGAQEVAGITFPQTFRTFALDEDGKPSERVTDSTLTDVAFEGAVDDARFAPPEGAAIIEGFGAR